MLRFMEATYSETSSANEAWAKQRITTSKEAKRGRNPPEMDGDGTGCDSVHT
jgi:hypothetical protein